MYQLIFLIAKRCLKWVFHGISSPMKPRFRGRGCCKIGADAAPSGGFPEVLTRGVPEGLGEGEGHGILL